MSEIISALSLGGPKPKLIPMQPRPTAETSKPLLPNVRFSIIGVLSSATADDNPTRRSVSEQHARRLRVTSLTFASCVHGKSHWIAEVRLGFKPIDFHSARRRPGSSSPALPQ